MTQTILHIDASARTVGSTSRALSARIVTQLAPARVIRRDLVEALPQITEDWIGANFTPADERNSIQTETLSLSDSLVAELRAADTIVIGAPIYNFSVPASLKAWIDLVCRAGVTFEYTSEGPRGLLSGKRVILAIASGGTQVGSQIDHATGYLRHIFGFIGLDDVRIIAADRLMVDLDTALSAAHAEIDSLAA